MRKRNKTLAQRKAWDEILKLTNEHDIRTNMEIERQVHELVKIAETPEKIEEPVKKAKSKPEIPVELADKISMKYVQGMSILAIQKETEIQKPRIQQLIANRDLKPKRDGYRVFGIVGNWDVDKMLELRKQYAEGEVIGPYLAKANIPYKFFVSYACTKEIFEARERAVNKRRKQALMEKAKINSWPMIQIVFPFGEPRKVKGVGKAAKVANCSTGTVRTSIKTGQEVKWGPAAGIRFKILENDSGG
ncbi:hypothetical protein [Enterococcus sp. 2201sp1_2201st1_B8_2201SCRN_220225]|uniref:hypothetical protein n=1 Tax=unclassified Enterococcus TaxID=2608891 RepID=UPI0034A27BE8